MIPLRRPWGPAGLRSRSKRLCESNGVIDMQVMLFLAILANSFDLFATAVGIHLFGNREGNPLLATLAERHWLVFVAVKGALVPLLIWWLYRYRRDTPGLSTAGLGVVTIALTLAAGTWLGWLAGAVQVHGLPRF
jgi:uncharacterized membrane protein